MHACVRADGSRRRNSARRAAAGRRTWRGHCRRQRVGLCGTDVEFYVGDMAYLHSGLATYPLRLGHEWAGRVASVGDGVDRAWLGRRVTGDTMLGDRTAGGVGVGTSTCASGARRSASG